MSRHHGHKTAGDESYNREIVVSASPNAAYRALTEEIDKWWAAPEGDASSVGDTPTFRFDPTYWTMRVEELVPGKRVVWKCKDANHIDEGLSSRARTEWVGTILRWEIERRPEGSKIRFVHEGLVPSLECYEICKAGWDEFFVGSLQKHLDAVTDKAR